MRPLYCLSFVTVFGLCACAPTGRSANNSAEQAKLASGSEPLVEFPTPEALEERLSNSPLEAAGAPADEYVRKWSFEETSAAGTAPWDETLAHLKADTPHVRTGDDMNCVAREMGLVFLRTRSMGDARLRRHVALHCGLSVASFSTMVQVHPTSFELDDDEAWSEFLAQGGQRQLDSVTKGPGDALGLHARRDGDRLIVTAVSAAEIARIQEVQPQPDEQSRVHVRGTLRHPVESLQVLLNFGRFGAKPCGLVQKDLRFDAYCWMKDHDQEAWFEVIALKKSAVLSTVVARGRAHRGPRPRDYPPRAATAAATDERSFASRLFVELNEVRARAGMSRLTANEEQSEAASRYLPHLLSAHVHGRQDEFDQIALGLLAGWSVPGEIRNGGLYLMNQPSRSPRTWLEESMESPLGRTVLLDPNASVVSAGVFFSHRQTAHVVIDTYELFNGNDHTSDEQEVLKILNRARTQSGKKPAVIVKDLYELEEAALSVRERGASPQAATDEAAQRVARSLGRAVWGMSLESYDLNQLRFPQELLSREELYVSVVVTHHRPAGAAWSQMVVLVLMIASDKA